MIERIAEWLAVHSSGIWIKVGAKVLVALVILGIKMLLTKDDEEKDDDE